MVTGRPGQLAPARGGEEKEKREIVCTPFRFKTAMFPLKDIHLCSGSGSRPAAAPPRLQRTLHRPCDPNLFANLMRFFFDFRFFLDSSCQYPTWYSYHTASDLARAADISTSGNHHWNPPPQPQPQGFSKHFHSPSPFVQVVRNVEVLVSVLSAAQPPTPTASKANHGLPWPA